VLRAVATRRPLLRATPTGITAAIDARGRVVAQLARGDARALVVDVWPLCEAGCRPSDP
jgi:apolipoprotein N-acyltransferase